MLKKRLNKQGHKSIRHKAYHRNTQYVLYVALFLVLILALVLVFEFLDFSKVKKHFDDPTYVEILDECSIIMGNLVHQVRDLDDCTIRCHNECVLMESDVDSVDFISSQSGCNTCSCYCK